MRLHLLLCFGQGFALLNTGVEKDRNDYDDDDNNNNAVLHSPCIDILRGIARFYNFNIYLLFIIYTLANFLGGVAYL